MEEFPYFYSQTGSLQPDASSYPVVSESELV